jgi:hypothetical protein
MRAITAICAVMTVALVVGAILSSGADRIACSLWAAFFIVYWAWMRWFFIPRFRR